MSPHRLALEKFVLAVVVYAFIGFGYLTVNHLVEGRVMHELWTPLDRGWPFNEHFIWAYLLVYVTPLSLLVFVDRVHDLRKAGAALVCNVAVAFPTFWAFPVTMPRPHDELELNWSGYMTDFIWQIDKPINCFPSIHVSVAFTAAFIVLRYSRLGGAVILLSAVAISVSTLYVRQHYILDIVAGILLGLLSYWAVFVKNAFGRLPLLRDDAALLM